MSNTINNDRLNTSRKGIKMRNILKVVFLFFIITAVSLGCIESQKLPDSNETSTPSVTEQKIPVPNETKPLKINDTFETWSRGYWSNLSYKQTYFRVITNYNDWRAFLDNQGYYVGPMGERTIILEGQLFPGVGIMPIAMEPDDFDNYFIIAAMMGRIAIAEGPEIEIKNISRTNEGANITIRMFKLGPGAQVESAPYHIVIVKKEILPKGNATFIFIDTEGKLLGKVEVKK